MIITNLVLDRALELSDKLGALVKIDEVTDPYEMTSNNTDVLADVTINTDRGVIVHQTPHNEFVDITFFDIEDEPVKIRLLSTQYVSIIIL